MTVEYEWDVESVSAVDTADLEEGEVVEHNHQTSYADAAREAALPAPEGLRFAVVLVRDDDEGRSWAYVEDGELPTHFTDANGAPAHRVPVRFVKEVSKTSRGGAR